jgi:hypothetical protein
MGNEAAVQALPCFVGGAGWFNSVIFYGMGDGLAGIGDFYFDWNY